MYKVERRPPFLRTLKGYKKHRGLEADIKWLEGKLKLDPAAMGDHVQDCKGLKYPVFKARLKDSCCAVGQQFGWRVFYAVDKANCVVFLLFLYHKRDDGNPVSKDLARRIATAFS